MILKTDQIDVIYKILQWILKPPFSIYMAQFGYHDTNTIIVIKGDKKAIEEIKRKVEYLHKHGYISEKEFRDFVIDYEISIEDQKRIQRDFEEDKDVFYEISDDEFIKHYCKTRECEITAIDRTLRKL